MLSNIKCTLCSSDSSYISTFRGKKYYRCPRCRAVLMDPADHVTFSEEKERYDQHKNDVNDPGYQNFVRPMVEEIKKNHSSTAGGLDYGAGPGPVASFMLKESGYNNVNLYDPFYHKDSSVLKQKYDFIICSEVVEHFREPALEFEKLQSILLPKGSLFIMTEIYSEEIDFEQWHYKNDPTHVIFYSQETFFWIKSCYKFNYLAINKRLIHFRF